MIAYPVLITCGRKYIISLLMLDIVQINYPTEENLFQN